MFRCCVKHTSESEAAGSQENEQNVIELEPLFFTPLLLQLYCFKKSWELTLLARHCAFTWSISTRRVRLIITLIITLVVNVIDVTASILSC